MVEESPRLLLARSRGAGSSKNNVPFSLKQIPQMNKDNFVGRDHEMQRLENYFLPPTSGRKFFVIHGPPGIGKTELACLFAWRHQDSFSAVFWLDGSSENQLKDSFVEAANRLRQDQRTDDITEALQESSKGDDSTAVAEGFCKWLDLPSNKQWLLIIDNVDCDHRQKDKDSEDRNRHAYNLENYLPSANHGSILVTSPYARLRDDCRPLELQTVKDSEAKQILENAAGKPVIDARPILDRLKGLPLALTLAGSYMMQLPKVTVSEYTKHYDQNWGNLVSTQVLPRQRTLGTVYSMAYTRVGNQSERAAGLLKLWGFLHYRDLWYGLIACIESLGQTQDVPIWLQQLAGDELQFNAALTCLSNYSLLDKRDTALGNSVHPVLHKWCCLLVEDETERRTLSWLAAQIVAKMVPPVSSPKSWKQRRRLLPHASRAYEMIHNERLETSQQARTCCWLGRLFSHHGKLDEAEKMFELALDGYIASGLGEGHAETKSAMTYLASTLYDQGKFGNAVAMQKAVLECMKATFDDKDRGMILAEHRLANMLHSQGMDEEDPATRKDLLAEAATMLADITYSDEDGLTISAMHSLAMIRRDQGELGEAEKILETVVERMRGIFGEDDPRTLLAVSDLAIALGDQGKFKKAAPRLQNAVRGMRRFIGDEHPVMHSLTEALKDEGNLEEAAEIFKTVLQRMRSIVGDKDPVMNSITIVLTDGGKFDEAEILKDIRGTLMRILNMETPFITSAPNNLQPSLVGQGQSVTMTLRRTLDTLRHTLGTMIRILDDTISSDGCGDVGVAWRGLDVKLPKGLEDLTGEVDEKGRELLGCRGLVSALFDPSMPSAMAASAEGRGKVEPNRDWVESDMDYPLKLFMRFKGDVRVHITSIHLTSFPKGDDHGKVPMRPMTIKLYKNPEHMLGFEDDEKLTQTIKLTPQKWNEETFTAKLELHPVWFKFVSSLELDVMNGDGDGEKMRLDRVRIIGSRP
ncbi:TPR-like protein [Zopfia rhizophila CBS 207.26]|uniref:TPR-like protein n=1 Tax=Zopfia rhizophila CBS 207.26 TaxID=1314779 RepID=A0A6A6DFI4_9PEZI|nr:TPR-like protein [Zopfia rhizophila CBS 207.26]